MRIKAKSEIKHLHEGIHYNPQEGDEITVPDVLGENWVANGWAVNVDTGEDNEPSTKPVTLEIQSVQHDTKNTAAL